MAGRFFARVPVVATAARTASGGAFGATFDPMLCRRGSKNYDWYFKALDRREKAKAAVAMCVCWPAGPGGARASVFAAANRN